MDTSKVTRIEIIDWADKLGGGRVYSTGIMEGVKIEPMLQDEGRTLKIFIKS